MSPTTSHAMKILGLVILILGAVLLFQGISRRDSLVGHVATASTDVANSFDGGSRTPLHVTYIIGGGVLVAVGAFLSFRKAAL
jgi:Protein of unknown function (DUF3185)